jgi:hypothetical protein
VNQISIAKSQTQNSKSAKLSQRAQTFPQTVRPSFLLNTTYEAKSGGAKLRSRAVQRSASPSITRSRLVGFRTEPELSLLHGSCTSSEIFPPSPLHYQVNHIFSFEGEIYGMNGTESVVTIGEWKMAFREANGESLRGRRSGMVLTCCWWWWWRRGHGAVLSIVARLGRVMIARVPLSGLSFIESMRGL